MDSRTGHIYPFLFLILMLCALFGCQTRPMDEFGSDANHEPAMERTSAADLEKASGLEQRAGVLYQAAQYDSALNVIPQAILIRQNLDALPSRELIADCLLLGQIHLDASHPTEAEQALQRAIRLSRKNAHQNIDLQADTLVNLGRVYLEQGKLDVARPAFEEARALSQSISPSPNVQLAASLNGMGQVGLIKGDFVRAGEAFAEAARILSVVTEKRPAEYGMALNGLAQVKRRMGQFVEARNLVEKALQVRQDAFGPAHPQVTRVLVTLIEIMLQLGQANEALPLAQKVVSLDEATFGATHPTVALRLGTLAQVKAEAGALTEALALKERALQIQTIAFGQHHFQLAQTLIEMATLHIRLQDFGKAVSLLERAIAIQKTTLGEGSVYLAAALDLLAGVQATRRNYDEAKSLYDRALQIREAALGRSHPDVATSFSNLAVLYHSSGELEKARPLYEEARQITMRSSHVSANTDEAVLRRAWYIEMDRLKNYARLLLGLRARSPSSSSAEADAFEVVEQARGWVVQSTVARLLARRAGKTAEERVLMDQLEQLRARRSQLWGTLQQSYASVGDMETQRQTNPLKHDLSQIEQELELVGKKVREVLPRYAELATPSSMTASEAQQLLNDGEALITYYYLDHGLKTWVIRRGQPVMFHDLQIEKDALTRLVQGVRDSLSPNYAPYHVASARRLYEVLLRPLESKLQGINHLIIVPDPLLVGLPFAALVMPSAKGDSSRRMIDQWGSSESGGYTALPWLVRRYATTILPTASSLRLVRDGTAPGSPGIPFIGFGDPLLPHADTNVSAMPANTTQEAGSSTRTGGLLKDLSSLPGTSRELTALAQALHANPRHLYMREQATEATVKRLSREGQLGKADIVSFATHALVPGEIEGISQPTLVMTPPARVTADEDGLLSMQEILELDLPHTSLVILSACNTGLGATSEEGISGLSRAFFYAGAKSLMVSHWSVDDHATEVLMTQIFKRYGDNPNLAPAEAMRGGMLALLDNTTGDPYPFLSHPYAWASFFLVGEGNRRLPR